ncbi:MAG: helix-turn-helix transcriptional regulator [Lentisphaerae bacterium]|nr:helix-turn-helix transcriptional regulator [Lentisphaerota bacterium]
MIETFGERLAKAITSSRQHRNNVAMRMGMTRSRLSDLIKGLTDPTNDEIERFSDLLQVPVTWMLTGKHRRN